MSLLFSYKTCKRLDFVFGHTQGYHLLTSYILTRWYCFDVSLIETDDRMIQVGNGLDDFHVNSSVTVHHFEALVNGCAAVAATKRAPNATKS